QDAGFLVTDRIATVAQIIAVVQTDTGDYRHMGIDYIDRIQATAQAYFQHHGIQPGPLEQPERRQGAKLEISQGDITTCLIDSGKGRTQIGIADRLAINADTFVVSDQMRGRVTAAAPSGMAQQAVQRRTGGTL